MATASTRRLTIADWRALPEGRPYVEFEKGEFIPMPSPTVEHQDIVDALVSPSKQFVRQKKLGRVFREVDVNLPDGEHGYIPDMSFLSTDRLHLQEQSPDRKIHGAPDLVAEVTSGQPQRDRVQKFRVYYQNGVSWYWIVDQETLTIEEYHAGPQGYELVARVAAGEVFRPQVFPGLTLDLAKLLHPPSSPSGE